MFKETLHNNKSVFGHTTHTHTHTEQFYCDACVISDLTILCCVELSYMCTVLLLHMDLYSTRHNSRAMVTRSFHCVSEL